MRNGFRSSRGAMRGIIGGTAGLATVAISFRSFPVRDVTRTRSSVFFLSHELGPTTTAKSFSDLSRGGDLFCVRVFVLAGIGKQIFVATGDGTEVQQLSAFAQRNGQHFGHMRSTDRVANQSPSHPGRVVAAGHVHF